MNIVIPTNIQVISGIITAVAIGGIAGYIGSLMLNKRMVLAGDALGHLALPGIVLALYYGIDISWGALIFLLFGMSIIWFVESISSLPTEAIIAVIFASFLALSFLLFPEEHHETMFLGDSTQLTPLVALVSVIVALILFFVIHHFFEQIIVASISSDLAQSLGIKVARNNFIYLVSIGLVIVFGIRMVGGLMTAALIAIPASASKNISRTLTQYRYGSACIGMLSSGLGAVFSYTTGLALGPVIILTGTLFFSISLLYPYIKIIK